jgi:hypothetical protein
MVYAMYEVGEIKCYFLGKIIHIGGNRNNPETKATIHFVAPPESIELQNPLKAADIGTEVDLFKACYLLPKLPTTPSTPPEDTIPTEPVIIVDTAPTLARLSFLTKSIRTNTSRSNLDNALVVDAITLMLKKFLAIPRTATTWQDLAKNEKALATLLTALLTSATAEVNQSNPEKDDITLNATHLKGLILPTQAEISFFLKQSHREDPKLFSYAIESSIENLANKVNSLSDNLSKDRAPEVQVHIGAISGNKNLCALNMAGAFNLVNAYSNHQLTELPNPTRTETQILDIKDGILLHAGTLISTLHAEALSKGENSVNSYLVADTKFTESFGASMGHVLQRINHPEKFLSAMEQSYKMFGITELTLNQMYTDATTHILYADGFLADPNREAYAHSDLGGHWFDASSSLDQSAKTKHNIAILSGQHYSYAYIVENDKIRLTFTKEELPSIAKELKKLILSKGTKPTDPQTTPTSAPIKNNTVIDLTSESTNKTKSYAQVANSKWTQVPNRKKRKPQVRFSGNLDYFPSSPKRPKNPGLNNTFIKGLPNSLVITTDKLAKNVCSKISQEAPQILESVENAFQSRCGHFVILQAPSGQMWNLHKHINGLRKIFGRDLVHKFKYN